MTVDELVERFEFFDDWEERYAYLIDLGRKLPAMPDELKVDANLVRGCLSRVWLAERVDAGEPPVITYLADSNTVITKGLIAIVLMLYSGRPAAEILVTDLRDVFERLGLDGHLTANRRNGFYAMLGRIKELAARHA